MKIAKATGRRRNENSIARTRYVVGTLATLVCYGLKLWMFRNCRERRIEDEELPLIEGNEKSPVYITYLRRALACKRCVMLGRNRKVRKLHLCWQTHRQGMSSTRVVLLVNHTPSQSPSSTVAETRVVCLYLDLLGVYGNRSLLNIL